MFKKGLRLLRKALRVILVLSGVIAVSVGSALSVSASSVTFWPIADDFAVTVTPYRNGAAVNYNLSVTRGSEYDRYNLGTSADKVEIGFAYNGIFGENPEVLRLDPNLNYTLSLWLVDCGSYAWNVDSVEVIFYYKDNSGKTHSYTVDADVLYSASPYGYGLTTPISFSPAAVNNCLDGFTVRFTYSSVSSDRGFYLKPIVLSSTNETIDAIVSGKDEIVGAIEGQQQAEQDAANQQGQQSIDDATSAIPDNSAGFISGINALATSMAYDGLEAKWDFPAIKMPAIPGVMEAVDLTGSLEIDFAFWVQKIPADILQIVQIVCTVALIVYCFKEVYSQISYALTQKGGGADA